MAYYEDTTTSWDISTDQGFRDWGKSIHDAFETVGLVQVPYENSSFPEGSIDWETVSTPSSEMTNNVSAAGHEIWRFDDPAQTVAPIYFRVSYGRGDSSGQARLSFSVGTGYTPGESDPDNPYATNFTSTGAAPTGTGTIRASFADGAFVFHAAGSTSSNIYHTFVIIERTRNSDGSLDGRFWQFVKNDGAGSARLFDGSWSAAAAYGVHRPPAEQETPVCALYVPGVAKPLRSAIFIPQNSVSPQEEGEVDLDGETLTYIALPQTGSSAWGDSIPSVGGIAFGTNGRVTPGGWMGNPYVCMRKAV